MNTTAPTIRPVPPPLPATREDLLARKRNQIKLNLHDMVDGIHMELWDDSRYQKLTDAIYNSQAVEGSLVMDDSEAARMIREHAVRHGIEFVAQQNLATLVKSLHVVLKRYNLTREERRNLVAGQHVEAPDSE